MSPSLGWRRTALLAASSLATAVVPALPATASSTAAEVVYVRYTGIGQTDRSSVVLQDLQSGRTRDLVVPGDEVYDAGPDLSRDGRQVAFSTARSGGGYGIAVVDRDGHGLHRLTDPGEEVEDSDPSWSADSRSIAFTRTDHTSGEPVEQVLRVTVTGSPLGVPHGGYHPAFSPDGKRMSYTDDAGQIVHEDLATGELHPQGRYGDDVAWSADGSKVVYHPTGEENTGALHVLDDHGGEQSLDGTESATSPRWLPDGLSLVYSVAPPSPQEGGGVLVAYDLQTHRRGVLAQAPPGGSLLFGTDVQGPVPDVVSTTGPESRFVPLTPRRVFDSRSSEPAPGPKGRVGAGLSVRVAVDATVGVPPDATAVVLNVTAVDPSSATYITAYPTGAAVPPVSNVNLFARDNVANSVTVAVGAGGVSLYNSAGDVDLVVDLSGYYTAGTGDGFATLPPVRVFDSRSTEAAPGPKGRLAAGGVVDVTVTGPVGQVPADATAVVLNLTGVAPTTSTLLRAYPTPGSQHEVVPLVSTVNLPAHANIANGAVVQIGAGGKIRLRNDSGDLDAVVDVVGYFSPTARGAFVPMTPTRFLDTRTGTGAAPLRMRPFEPLFVRLTGPRGIPRFALAVAANLTAVDPSTGTVLRAYPRQTDDRRRPLVSTLNPAPHTVRANALYLQQDEATGLATILNDAGDVHVLLDVTGYFVPTA